MTIVEDAPAKINLALHVRHRRADGYHALETLFAFARDGDRIAVTPAEQDSFAIDGPFAAGLASEGDNLVTRARDRFRAQVAPVQPVAITLTKALPIASGIGGGSADAAAMLRALARLADVSVEAVMPVAIALGADVPACVLGRTSRGVGRGDELVELDGLTDIPLLLVNPLVAVSTAAVFAGWDGVDRGALATGDPMAAAVDGRNDLEPAARAVAPVIDAVLAMLAAQPGVRLARMSGSGATCFALFGDGAQRDAADRTIAAAHPDWWRLASRLA